MLNSTLPPKPTPASSSRSAKGEAGAVAGAPSSHADPPASASRFPPSHFPPSQRGGGTHCLYDLCAVVVHHGQSLSHGHYTAFVRHLSGEWYHIDDANVTLVGPAEVAAAEAYLLFYERRQDPRWKEQRLQVMMAC